MARLTSAERLRAVARLESENMLTLEEAACILDAPAVVLQRWIVQGKSGKHLDGIKTPTRGWLTSRQAIARFLAGTENGDGKG